MSMTDLVTPLKRQTLSADVYAQLRELLMGGRLMPGEPISLRSMATALGVSVMPVREAVHRLVAEQALELTPNRVLRVPLMSVNRFREIVAIRVHLEGLATSRAAEVLSESAVEQVRRWHESFAREMERSRPDGAKLIALNKELHFAVYRGAEMPTLLQLIETLWLRIGPILNYDLRSGASRLGQRVAVEHHARLLQALQRRDPQAARAALQGDIESAAEFILSSGVLETEGLADAAAAPAAGLKRGAAQKLRGAGRAAAGSVIP